MKDIKNDKIFDLLAEKSFDQLNEKEHEEVLQEMDKTEYEQFQLLIKDFKNIDDSIHMKEDKIESKKEVTKVNWWNFRIPSYQVAACLVLAMSLTFFLTKKSITKQHLAETKKIQTDTYVKQVKGLTLEEEDYPSALVLNW